jgi:hypothetical protein
MKTLKTLTLILLSTLIFSCSSDDDSSSGDSMQATSELLTSGTWYQESKTPEDFTACEKNGSIQFTTNNTLIVESFDDNSGDCESLGPENATYTLSNDTTITIVFGMDTLTATIISISATMLSITNDNGETIVFDKTQG